MTALRNGRLTNGRTRFAFIAGAAAFCGVLAITSGYGPGLDPDSMAYVGSATSLAHGNGLRVPLGKWERSDSTVALTVWPPAFPIAMAVPQVLGATPLLSARLVLAASAFVTIAGTVLILSGAVSPAAAVIGLIAIIVTPSFTGDHLSALSEPLFLAFLTMRAFGMVKRRVALASVGAVGSAMTRYAGVSAAIGAAIWFLIFDDGPLRERLRRAVLSSAPAALAFFVWMIHNSRAAVVQSPITLGYHPGISSTLGEGLRTIGSWLGPGLDSVESAAVAAALAALIVILVLRGFLRRTRAEPTDIPISRITSPALILLGSYLFVIVCSRLFVGGAIEFDARILSPAIFIIEIAMIAAIYGALRKESRTIRIAAGSLITLWIVAACVPDAAAIRDAVGDGNDFAASDWRDSPSVAWVKNEGGARTIYTNWPAAIYFDAQRKPFDIPTSAEPDTLRLFGKILSDHNGAFVAFDTRNFDYPSVDSIVTGAGLVKLKTFDDGTVWVASSSLNASGDARK